MKSELSRIWEDPAKEIGEVLLDEALEKSAPALAKIPLLSTLSAAVQSGRAWSDYLLAKKVQQFYSGWEALSKKDRKIVYEKFQKRPKDFLEKLLFILDQQEDGVKCKLLGMLTIRYLQNKIKRAEYYDLIETVNGLSVGDLEKLVDIQNQESLLLRGSDVTERYASVFIGRGLLITDPPIPDEQRFSNEPVYRFTENGEVLASTFEEASK